MIGVRILTAFACGVDLVLMGLLFQQVGRFFIPRWQMRALMVTAMVITATIGLANLQHVHRPPNAFTWAIGLGMISKAIVMATIVHWYGSTAGRRHVAAMLASADAGRGMVRTPLERRVDQLLVAVIAVFAILLFTLLVVGVTAARNRGDEERTHAALCTFEGDLAQRVTSTQDYLAKHQEPLIFGVPRTTIVTNLNNQERTLASLSGLGC